MAARIPTTIKKLVVNQLSHKFREAVQLVTAPMPQLGSKDILIKNRYLGINASDINHTAGRYDPSAKPPFDCGMEGLGEVVAAGPDSLIKPGQAVTYQKFGAFADYVVLDSKHAFPIPAVKPEYITMPISALTAAISLDKVGEMKKGETVLVTAAAGGTGQFAVQLAKQAGCHVIGTCSSDAKVEFLKTLGCDRPINYNKEKLHAVLKSEYPKGIDVVYETIGTDVFDICVNRLAVKGRLIIIGFISGYETDLGFKQPNSYGLPAKLLTKSASIRGFFLFHYMKDSPRYAAQIIQLIHDGKIQALTDNGAGYENGPFKGIESVFEAVEYMYTRRNVGKIVVDLQSNSSKL